MLPDVAQSDAGAVGIFALADPFDAVLRALSPSYFERAWNTLARLGIDNVGLRLGYTHPSYTSFGGEAPGVDGEPHAWFGFVDPGSWFSTRRNETYAEVVAVASPPLACGAADIRAQAFHVAADDFALAVRIFRAFATDEVSDWIVAAADPAATAREPWRFVAHAWNAGDPALLAAAMARAEETYSLDGFLVVVDAVARLEENGVRDQ